MLDYNPLVSICIPTYNSALYLSQTLESIANQTYKNIEVIISDNASTDDTPKIIQMFCKRYGWAFHQNEFNIGAGNNFNKLIDLANGQYVAIYHADDVYKPTIIEKSVQAFQSKSDLGLIGTMGCAIDQNNNYLQSYNLPKNMPAFTGILDFDYVYNGILLSRGEQTFFITPSIMVKKECYDILGKFNISERYKSAGDYEMWLRIAQSYPIYIINEQLIQYRIHPAQGSETEIRQNIEIYDILTVMEDYSIYISKKKTKEKFLYWKNHLLIHTALKQNGMAYFYHSQQTLKKINDFGFIFIVMILRLCNFLKIKLPFYTIRTLYQKYRS